MKIEPKEAPAIVQPATGKTSARDRAIAALMQNAPKQESHPVANPSNVSPEEMSVVKAPQKVAQTTEITPENHNSEAESKSTKSTEEATHQETKEDTLSTQYANLARKEKALRAKALAEQQALKAKEEAIAAREKALAEKEAEYKSNFIPKSKLKTDPLSVLAEEGISYDELTNAILNPQMKQDPRVLAELERLKAEVETQKQAQEQSRKLFEEQKRQEYNQAVAVIKKDVERLVTRDPAFETIKETGSIQDVVDLIEKTYKEDGVLLEIEEAAQEVENYLVEEALKIAKINKIKQKLMPEQKQEPKQEQATPQQQPTMKTLTNAVNASKPVSARERAILAFKGNLK